MSDTESRRGVLPNGELIDTLRKRKGWTIEDFATGTSFKSCTAQKAIAGLPVDIQTLIAIAKRLNVPFETLLITSEEVATSPSVATGSVQITSTGVVLNLHIKLSVSKEVAATSIQLAAVMEMLQKLLPDSKNITIVAVTGATAIVSVALTPANVLALSCSSGIDTLNITRVTTPDHYLVDGIYKQVTDEFLEGFWTHMQGVRSFYMDLSDPLKPEYELSLLEQLISRIDRDGYGGNTHIWVRTRLNTNVLDDLKRRIALWQSRRKPE